MASWFVVHDPLLLKAEVIIGSGAVLGLILLRRGHNSLAAWSLVIPIWLVLLLAMATVPDGRFSIAYTAMIIPIIAAGLLLGRSAALAIAIASGLAGLLVGSENPNPTIGHFVEVTAASNLFSHLGLFGAAVGLVVLAVDRISRTLGILERNEVRLDQRNKELSAEISRRQEMEAQLRQSEDDHRRISQMTSDLTFKYVTREDAPPSQQWIFGACEEITGYTPDELDAAKWASVVVPGEEGTFDQRHADSVECGKNSSEFRIRTKTGEIRWVSQQLQVVAKSDGTQVFGAVRDITERKQTELTLKRERDFTSAILGSAAVMVAVLDSTGRIVRANEASAQFVGLSLGELEGSIAANLGTPEDVSEGLNALAKTLQGESAVLQLKSPIQHAGTFRWAEWSTRCLRGDGEIFVIATGIDITERRRAEEELATYRAHLEELVRDRSNKLARSERRLVDAERLASVGTLAAGVAHQINNPIGAILASAEYALVCEDDENERDIWRSSLETNIEEAKRCGQIVRSVLHFSSGGRAEKWPANLADVLRRVCRLSETHAKAHAVALELDLAEAFLMVLISPIEIEQVLVNVIRNAIESGDQNTRVEVKAVLDETTVRVTVVDGGRGIEADRIKYVFDPFYTTKANKGGTGLGLSVAHGIVLDHKGQMQIQSEGAGRGTTLTIELPLYRES